MIQHLSRQEFIEDYFSYYPGEHLNVISPTGAGKSELIGQLSEKVLDYYPHLRYVSFMPKLKDETASKWKERLDLREVQTWPPAKRLFHNDSRYLLWPKHNVNDEDENRRNLTATFRKGINSQYADGNSLTVVDDAYIIGVLYGMNPELDRHWIAGRSNQAGLWTSLQKPSGTVGGAISSFAYNSPTHLFLGKDTDKRNLDRFSEIGTSTLEPDYIKDLVRNLAVRRIGNSAVSEMLYLDRRGPYLCVVGID